MWLLEPGLKKKLEENTQLYAEEQIIFESKYEPAGYVVNAGLAEIEIVGVITKRPDFLAYLFGGNNTTYGEISGAIEAANADRKVSDIQLNIDSPGGAFDGLFDLLATIQQSSKPISSYVDGMAASAAYAIASQTGSIIVKNRSALVGSIGVVASFYTDSGLKRITSTQAPKKAPDPDTTAGRKAIVEQLDALHELFVEAIAAGRGTDEKTVNRKYGQGALILADEALKRGMIDSIENTGLKGVKNVEAKTEDYQAGIDAERDRVLAHLTMGEASGDMKTACLAIRDGSAMTAELQAKYLAAGMNKADIKRRQDDDIDVDGKTEVDPGTQVIDMIEKKMGVNNG